MRRIDHLMPSRSNILVYIGLGLVVSALNSVSAVADYQNGGGTQVWRPIVWECTSVFVTTLLIHPVFLCTRFLPFSHKNWPWRLIQHLVLSLLFSALHTGGMVLLRQVVYAMVGESYDFGDWLGGYYYELSKDLLTYQSLVLISYGFLFWEGLRNQQMKTLSLETEMAELKLRRLREQLRPHFLFNTLNLISNCMYEDVEKADKLMADLCTLLRHSLNKGDRNTIDVAEEVRFLTLYLSLVNARFSGKLSIDITVDPEVSAALMPRFLLQPLAENAIEHGFEDRRGHIRVTITRREERLLIVVADDGSGLQCPRDELFHKGLGLGNNRAILNQMYGTDFLFELTSPPEGGTTVTVDIPLQLQRED